MRARILTGILLTCVLAGACLSSRSNMTPRSLPGSVNPLVIRTEFHLDREWKQICAAVRAPVQSAGDRCYAHVDFLDDSTFQGLSKDALLVLVPESYKHSVLFIVDEATVSHPEHPILAVDLRAEKGRSFRAIPSAIQSIENNLSIANMDFFEFANPADKDGVFRGFPCR